MIKMTNVYKEYPNGMKAIAGLTVNIKQGEFVYVVGPSGAGKSTFIKMMYREEKPSTGSINVNGLTIESLAERDVPYFRRQLIYTVSVLMLFLITKLLLSCIKRWVFKWKAV